jgi:uncharacterized protein
VKVYVDSSVILRVVLGEAKRLREWSRISVAVSSEIARVETLRVLDRLRLLGMDEKELARRRAFALEVFGAFDLVRINRAVLERASSPFPTQIRTLDAIHLSSALLAQPRYPALRFATHDEELGTAALSVGFRPLGV